MIGRSIVLIKTSLDRSAEEKIRLTLSLNQIILRKTPGNADRLASQLGISRSTFFRILSYMKYELNAPINYDEYRKR